MAHRSEMPHRYTNEANETPSAIEPARNGRALARRPAWEAFWILRVGFTAAPILAGLDKFFHLLTNWDNYLAPVVNRVLGGHGHSFLLAAGVIEPLKKGKEDAAGAAAEK